MSKCNYSYLNLKRVILASLTQLAKSGQMEIADARKHYTVICGILQICEEDKETAKALLKMGKKIFPNEKGEKND